MFAVAVTLAAVVAIVVALAAVPLRIVVDAERDERFRVRGRLSWLYGLVDVEMAPGRRATDTAPRRPTARRRRRSPRNRARGRRMGTAVIRTRGLVGAMGHFLVSLTRRVSVEEFRLRSAFGLDDPADTGILFGCLAPWLSLAAARGLDVECCPMFQETGLTGSLHGALRVRPLAVVGTLAAFLVSPPVLRAMGSAWRAR